MEQTKDVDLTFFVPCLNEAKTIRETFENISGAMKTFQGSFEVLVYDDASTDGCPEVVESLYPEFPDLSIRLFRRTTNRGPGFNYFEGSHKARGKYYMQYARGSADFIRTIVGEFGKYDMVIPYLALEVSRGPFREFVSWTFTSLVHMLSGTSLKYYNCSVLHVTENVRKSKVRASGYGYQAELLCELLGQRKTYIEVEVVPSLRKAGKSKAFKPANVLSVAASLLRIFGRRLRYGSARNSISSTISVRENRF